MRCLHIAGAASLMAVLTASTHAANVLVVGGAFGDNNDAALVSSLESLGHIVSNPVATHAAASPTALNLTEVDLILMARSANSGDYDDNVDHDNNPATPTVGEAKLWNELNKPMLVMSAAHIRGGTAATTNRRWGWVDSTTTVDNAPGLENFDPFLQPSHAFVAGRTTNVFPDVGEPLPNPPGGNQDITVDYINTQSVPSGAVVVATMTHTNTAVPPVTNTFATIIDYPTGTTMFLDDNAETAVTTARRAYMQMHDYQDNANVFSLTPNGMQIFDQIIRTLAPTTTVPADVNGNGVTDINDYIIIRNNFFGTGRTRAQGDVTGDGNVNFADFRHWKNNRTAGSGSFTDDELLAGLGVPEPGSLALAMFGALAWLGASRRRAG